MSVGLTQSAAAYGYAQLQRQAAYRNAEELEAKAASLAAEAASARKAADEAGRQASEVEIQAGSARTAADNAKLAVATGEGTLEMGQKLGEQLDRILQSMRSADESKTLYGPDQGSSNSAYTAGSVFNLSV